MITTLTYDQLEETFGASAIARLPESSQPVGLTHGPTRSFLSATGVPVVEGALFEFVQGIGTELTPLLEDYDEEEITGFGLSLDDVRNWFFLGEAVWSGLALDGATGAVYALHGEEEDIEHIHTDLSGMVFGMSVLASRRPEFTTRGNSNDLDAIKLVVADMTRIISEVDPLPFAREDGLWSAVMEDFGAGMW